VWPELNSGYPYTYGEGAWLREQILESGRVRLVLSGHYHRGVSPFRENSTYFATVPGFAEHPHPYWIYEIDGHQVRHRQSQVIADTNQENETP
jgi:hypothetical protein